MSKQEKSTEQSNRTEKFEVSLERLERVVEAMEKGDLTLEQTLQHYEEGMKLAKYCAEKLGDAEKKIEVLSGKNAKGEDQWEKMNMDIGFDQ